MSVKPAVTASITMAEAQNELLEQTMKKERRKLLDFIRRRIPADTDPEDIVQDVFFEYTQNLRMERVIGQVSSWLYRVARNKIADIFRRRKTESLEAHFASENEDGEEGLGINDLLPDPSAGPEAIYTRRVLMDELMSALDELPEEQREAFWMNEVEGKSFREISEETGVPLNTLLSRKRYAVLFLRERLREIYNDMLNN
ncbi:MAG: ECF subfamily RNA polymerase sigma-24 subunit [Bacteroidetes bacterium]|nr:MAG: ECF subfamily RNA polymerase sigma-24 subunit [Bacteroidota bacterium]